MLNIDLRDFERKAKQMGHALDQVPYALANAMSSAAFKAQEVLITETWPGHVTVRNRRFLGAALRIEKATKRNLRVVIYDRLGRAHLGLHAKGGTKRSRGRLAIPPPGSVRRTAKGVAKNQTPRAIIDRTPKRALRITSKGIFVGQGGRLRLKYVFKPSAQISRDVPFMEDFRRIMRREMEGAFRTSIANAMKTRGLKGRFERELALGRRSWGTQGAAYRMGG